MSNFYKHKNNTDVAVEVLSFFQPTGKDYARIKVRWWRIGLENEIKWCMNITQTLTDADIVGSKKQKTKYPVSKWESDWVKLEVLYGK